MNGGRFLPERKPWVTPSLSVLGRVEEITQQQGCDKNTGGSDGFTFLGTPIVCVS